MTLNGHVINGKGVVVDLVYKSVVDKFLFEVI
jgi:hypothetical protein